MPEERHSHWVRRVKAGSLVEINGTRFYVDHGVKLAISSHIDTFSIDGRAIIADGKTVAPRAPAEA